MKNQQIQAAYFVCLAWGMEPSVRNISEMARRITTNGTPGRGFRYKDICAWLKSRETVGQQEPPAIGKRPSLVKTPIGKQAGNSAGNLHAGVAKVLESEYKTVANATVRRPKPMKQPALDLGASSPPEIDFDRRRLDIVDGLPEHIPEAIDDLRELAKVFAVAFGYLKNTEKIRKAAPMYSDVLAGMRKSGVTVERAWDAFRDAVIAREGQPLVGALPKTAFAYLGTGRRPFTASSAPRLDSCGCKLPDGVFMPKMRERTDTAHWDGDQFVYGNTFDPPRAR